MSPSHRIPEQYRTSSFRASDALRESVPRSLVDGPAFVRPFRGVRVSEAPRDIVAHCHAYLPVMPSGHYFSHATAALLWGMWLPLRCESSTLHVTAPLPHRAPRMTGVVGHKASVVLSDILLECGLPLVSPLDAWRQLAPLLTLDELVAAGDSLLRRKRPLATRSQLVVALARHGGGRGVRKLRAAFEEVRAGCDSPRETRLRVILVRSGLPEPIVNAVVSRPGQSLRYGDLVYREWRVIVEYDGAHHFTPTQRAADILRLEQLRAEGWIVIIVIAAHLDHPMLVVSRVEAALRSRGWRR